MENGVSLSFLCLSIMDVVNLLICSMIVHAVKIN